MRHLLEFMFMAVVLPGLSAWIISGTALCLLFYLGTNSFGPAGFKHQLQLCVIENKCAAAQSRWHTVEDQILWQIAKRGRIGALAAFWFEGMISVLINVSHSVKKMRHR